MRRALAAAGLKQPDIVAATIGPGLAAPCWWEWLRPRHIRLLGGCRSMR